MYSSYWTPNDGRESTVLTDHEALHRDADTHKSMQSDEAQLRPLDLETIMSSKAAVKFWYLHRPKTMQYVHKNATKMQSLGRAYAVRKLREKHGAEYMAELARQDQIKRDHDALKDLTDEERAAKQLDDAAYDARVEESRRLRREQIEAERLAEEELRMKQAEAASERRRLVAEQEAAAALAKEEADKLAEEERVRAEQEAEAERVRKLEEDEAERVRLEEEQLRAEEERLALEKEEAKQKAEEDRLAALEAARLAEEARVAAEEEEIRAEEERLRLEEEARLAEEERVRQEEEEAARAEEERLRLEEEARVAEEERAREEEEAALVAASLAREQEKEKEKERLREEQERLAREKAEAQEKRLAEEEQERQELLRQEKMERYEQSLSKDVPVLVRQRGPGRVVRYDKEDETYDVRMDNAMGGVRITVPSDDVNLDDDRILSPRTKVDTPFGTGQVVGLDPHVGCYAINTDVNAPEDDQFLAFVQIQDVAVHEEELEERAIVEDASLPIPDEIGLVSARIVDSRIVNRTGKKFIQYKLEICTSNYGTVYCWKRYSTFRSLCDRLVKETGLKKRDIPELPHRHIVGNFSQNTVGERAEKLNLFLNAAVKAEHLQWGIRVDDQIAVYKRRNKRATQTSSQPSSSTSSNSRTSRGIFSRRR